MPIEHNSSHTGTFCAMCRNPNIRDHLVGCYHLSLFEILLEELYEEDWDVSEAVADLREMTDEHIRIIVQTSQKDGIENRHVKKKVEN